MLPMLELLSNSPYGCDVLSDDEEDDYNGVFVGSSIHFSTMREGNGRLTRLRFLGDAVIYGADLKQAALLVRSRGKWSDHWWTHLELTFFVEFDVGMSAGPDGVQTDPLPLNLEYWNEIYGRDLDIIKSVTKDFHYTFKVDQI